jgi:hypothetical protein
MFIIAHHQIQDTDTFWSIAKEISSIPSNLKLLGVYPSADMRLATCFWEASRVEDVQKFLDESVGKVSKNTAYEVNESMAMGMPHRTEAGELVI